MQKIKMKVRFFRTLFIFEDIIHSGNGNSSNYLENEGIGIFCVALELNSDSNILLLFYFI
jgi:hypothetical protein